MYLHTLAVELLYKRNITRVAVRYGCISACCDYLRPNHSYADIQPYHTAKCVIYIIYIYIYILCDVIMLSLTFQIVQINISQYVI